MGTGMLPTKPNGMLVMKRLLFVIACLGATLNASAEVAADYLRPVRPIGVDGQPAWNVRSVFFMYPPTFGFARRDEAASYQFTVKDESGAEQVFIGRSPNDSLAPVWGKLPLSGWMDVRCEAMDAQGRVTAKDRHRDKNGKPFPHWPMCSNEPNRGLWWGNMGPGPKGNGLDVRELSRAEVNFRRRWWEQVREMQKTPGWEKIYIANTCSQIGVRATRLVDAEFVVDAAAARGQAPADTVAWAGDGGSGYGIAVPYRQLLPKKVENLLCCGRMLGAPDTIETLRLITPCMTTGEAAGVAAAMAAKQGVHPRDLDVKRLRNALAAANVYLD